MKRDDVVAIMVIVGALLIIAALIMIIVSARAVIDVQTYAVIKLVAAWPLTVKLFVGGVVLVIVSTLIPKSGTY